MYYNLKLNEINLLVSRHTDTVNKTAIRHSGLLYNPNYIFKPCHCTR